MKKLVLAAMAFTVLGIVPALAANSTALERMVAHVIGVGNPHGQTIQATAAPHRAQSDPAEWDTLYSRDPYPNMGIGNVH